MPETPWLVHREIIGTIQKEWTPPSDSAHDGNTLPMLTWHCCRHGLNNISYHAINCVIGATPFKLKFENSSPEGMEFIFCYLDHIHVGPTMELQECPSRSSRDSRLWPTCALVPGFQTTRKRINRKRTDFWDQNALQRLISVG